MPSNHRVPPHTWLSPKVAIQHSIIDGRGMFAIDEIVRGERIVIWGGKWGEDYMDAEAAGKKHADESLLIIQWDDDLYSVETSGDRPGYFVNHACDPNAWMEGAFTLVARRDIHKDEEITTDYALLESHETYVMEWTCQCGSRDCRTTISGADWRLTDLQQRYNGHFSPLNNKRIERLGGRR